MVTVVEIYNGTESRISKNKRNLCKKKPKYSHACVNLI